MNTKTISFFLCLVTMFQCTNNKETKKPPLAPVNLVEDIYFGQTISDPYRYIENLKDSAVLDWFKVQSDYSRTILDKIKGRQSLIDKMWEYDQRVDSKISDLNITEDDRYFYLKTTPSDETGKLYYRDGYEGEEHLLYDPGVFSSDTTLKYVISGFTPSFDGEKVCFEVTQGGSESSILLILEVVSRSLYPEQIDNCWLGMHSWLPDGTGFLYNRSQSSDVHNMDREIDTKVFLHIIGSDPRTDKEIFSRAKYPDLDIKPEEIPLLIYDIYSNYLFGFVVSVDKRRKVFYAPVGEFDKEKIDWKQLFKTNDEVYDFYPTENYLYFRTPKNSNDFQILRTSLHEPDIVNAETIVPVSSDGTITDYHITKNGLFYTLSINGVQEKLFYLPKNANDAIELKLPFTAGSISLESKGFKFSDFWVIISGWTSNKQRFRYLVDRNEFIPENLSDIAEYPEYDDLIVEEVMVKSHDGVDVPLSLVYNKGIKKDGNNQVLIRGYGAYGSSWKAGFRPNSLLWTLEGGIFAVAHVRGGGELGEPWHKGGFKTTKPNTWKDLIACAEYLINEQYTTSRKIAILSASAGGILVGRAMTERPDLFAAVIPAVGCMNTIRGEESPNGPINAPEFGTIQDSIECMALIEMDSYHHIEDGISYPATLVTAGMNDPRVIVWEPAKFAARLQAANTSDNPILFLVDYEAGHGMGDTKSKQFESWADKLSFALWQTGNTKYTVSRN